MVIVAWTWYLYNLLLPVSCGMFLWLPLLVPCTIGAWMDVINLAKQLMSFYENWERIAQGTGDLFPP
jgi:hypothetical protein